MTSPIPPPFSMPSPSQTFSFPSTSEPVFSVSTSEPVFESPNSQTSQNTQSQQQFQQYHTTTVSNNNAKFPYLKKDEYETWAMKMEYWIMNSDHNLWNIVLNGNSRKKTGRDPKGNIMILPPVSGEEHIVVQRETKARTILLQSLPEDHMADFHHLDDARDIWLAVKARFGGNDESKKMSLGTDDNLFSSKIASLDSIIKLTKTDSLGSITKNLKALECSAYPTKMHSMPLSPKVFSFRSGSLTTVLQPQTLRVKGQGSLLGSRSQVSGRRSRGGRPSLGSEAASPAGFKAMPQPKWNACIASASTIEGIMCLRRGKNTQLRADPNILQKNNTPICTAPAARIYLHEDNSPSRSVSREEDPKNSVFAQR
ncbi:hypothetical protein Tco_1492613 [Tanacetum coccineum]